MRRRRSHVPYNCLPSGQWVSEWDIELFSHAHTAGFPLVSCWRFNFFLANVYLRRTSTFERRRAVTSSARKLHPRLLNSKKQPLHATNSLGGCCETYLKVRGFCKCRVVQDRDHPAGCYVLLSLTAFLTRIICVCRHALSVLVFEFRLVHTMIKCTYWYCNTTIIVRGPLSVITLKINTAAIATLGSVIMWPQLPDSPCVELLQYL